MVVSSPAEQQRLHTLAVEHFLASAITYKFNACLIPLPEDENMFDRHRRARCPLAWSRFVFSKPTMQQPEPLVVVTIDVETIEERPDGTFVYSMLPEGQVLRRPLIFDPKDPKAFMCEFLIDNVYQMKERTMQKYSK